jgi:membrane-associated protein
VAGGRLVPAVRILVMPTAGASSLPWRRFVLADVAGVAAWATLHVTVGYLVGLGIDQLDDRTLIVLLAVAAVVVAGVAVVVHHRKGS